MNLPENDQTPARVEQCPPKPAAPPADLEWVNGLKQLYGSVVNEPLPAALQDLLDRLDDSDSDDSDSESP